MKLPLFEVGKEVRYRFDNRIYRILGIYRKNNYFVMTVKCMYDGRIVNDLHEEDFAGFTRVEINADSVLKYLKVINLEIEKPCDFNKDCTKCALNKTLESDKHIKICDYLVKIYQIMKEKGANDE